MPPRSTIPHALTAWLLTIAITGCGLHNPYRTATRHTVTTTSTTGVALPADQGDPPPERGGTIGPGAQAQQTRLAAGAALLTPQAALARYARIYLNWNAANVIAVQRELATISLDQARAQALQAAASAARDPKLTRGHIANHGQVIAIAPGQGPANGHWVIVTSEQTTGDGDYQGLPPTLHVIYAQLAPAHDVKAILNRYRRHARAWRFQLRVLSERISLPAGSGRVEA